MSYKSLNLNDFFTEFWGVAYCRGLNSPALYRLSYRGIFGCKLKVHKKSESLGQRASVFFAKPRIVAKKYGEFSGEKRFPPTDQRLTSQCPLNAHFSS